MSVAFCLLGASVVLLTLSLGPRLRTQVDALAGGGCSFSARPFRCRCLSSSSDKRCHRLSARRVRTCCRFPLAEAFTLIGRNLANSEVRFVVSRRVGPRTTCCT